MNTNDHVLIVGGGLVGASLACALEPLGLRITVVESTSIKDQEQTSFDNRSVAITWSSRQIFNAIGIWKDISALAHPIRSIHVSDRGHVGVTHLDCSLINTEALGYVIPTRTIGQALVDRMNASSSIELLVPAQAKDINLSDNTVSVECNGLQQPNPASLLVLADGGKSSLALASGVTKKVKLYKQSALVTTIESDWKHDGMAFERFTVDGPIALLPMEESSFSLAWTLPTKKAEHYAELVEGEFLKSLQRYFGYRAGLFKRVTARKIYPLRKSSMSAPSIERTVLIGNAAHEVHPVAGQGFNLGLSDVAELTELIANAVEDGIDVGHYSVIEGYLENRSQQTARVMAFTDTLINIFGITTPGAGFFRGIGLNTIEVLPPIKRFLLRRTTGLSGRQTRLVRGLPLTVSRNDL